MGGMAQLDTEKDVRLTLALLDRLVGVERAREVGVRLWDGTDWPDDSRKKATLVLKHPGSLRAMFIPGTELGLSEAYLFDDFDVEGDMLAVLDMIEDIGAATGGWGSKLLTARDLMRLPVCGSKKEASRGRASLCGGRHTINRDRQAIRYHYDVSNDFYALWLDRRMVYSCAYFHSENEDLETAQGRKLDYICRKLRLKKGQRLLDIGCGWGGLAMYAADMYGADTTGITVSRAQHDLANKRIVDSGLENTCRVEVKDYREVEGEGIYDAVVSVGMFEHVGTALMPVYFEKAFKLLKPGGVFLNHGIATRLSEGTGRRPGFSDTYVFPDGELTTINQTLQAAEEVGFEVRDVESLREHYKLTTLHWARRLESCHAQALQHVHEPTYRVWRLLANGSAHGFAAGRMNLYQTLLVKPYPNGKSGFPLTRLDWYH